ncbi:low-density lipoprotein receptor-related protein 4 [Anthonomus grandis grandis]|uniref:low-density lipoprotein receptor-related protein 4 n=1 Tax=Anthonomus grandis grandis TaxID=2921223 RepID=UPI0021658C2D|nr:low-density lipoprotein receptor-related protein 4 [Anthonomus grandis grandis]
MLYYLPKGIFVGSVWVLVISCVTCDPEYSKNATSPVHPGAARQMYGSSSLRQSGKKNPVLATGQRKYGVRTTIKPDLQSRYPFSYPYEYFPLPIPAYAIPSIFEKPDFDGPQNRGGGVLLNGMYGGRVEYPTLGVNPANVPWGMISGRGYGDSYDVVGQDDAETSQCSVKCKSGMFLCKSDCSCIKGEYRCDGRSHCSENEDEETCNGPVALPPDPVVICDESKNFILCPKTKRCVSRDWLCDGDDDCGDYSDETRCGFLQNCTSDQFQCENGLCIPKVWICDNDNDCRDFSDETNCTKIACSAEEYECTDGKCISINWKCDHHIDCIDGSDERECDLAPAHCNEREFQCSNRKCIKFEFKCDGDDDCDDWSDENDCPRNIGECVSGEFKCKNGECIPKRWVCDNQKDCPNEEDEANCEYAVNKTCNSDEYTCPGGQCILKTWVCDGVEDCPHGEEESKCDIVCDDAKFPCTGPGANGTAVVFCIAKKRKCDGHKDCPKGDDEKNCPARRDCEPKTKCEQLCVTYNGERNGCGCNNGFKLDKDGVTCNDIDECMYATDPVCSQKCNNTVGSFKCGCMTGYVLRPDLRTCKAVGAPPTLLFANRIDIRQMSLSNTKYKLLLKGLHNVISLDYHYEKQLIFYSDVSTDKIKSAAVNGTDVSTIVSSGLDSPGGLAVDWIHDLLYWTDSGTKRVEVSKLDGSNRAVIVANELDKPRAIAIHPDEAFVFWSDWGPNPKIERAEMDGSGRKSIVTESIFWPNGLTIDYTLNQIYWADAKHNVIECSLLDGSKRKKVITKGLPHPFAITIFEDALFWTDWHTKSIATANKLTGAGYKALHSRLHFPMDIRTFHPQRQPMFNNRCGSNNGGCEHLCLPNRRSFTCVCHMGQRLRPDKKTCHNPDVFLLLAKKRDLRIKHLDGATDKQYEMVIPLENVKNAVSVAWDSDANLIFWADIAMKTINRAFWNGSSHEVIVGANLASPRGLAYDWATSKLYWTDAEFSRIEVAYYDGSSRSLLIWENLDKPCDIIVDPHNRLMFWADQGASPKIEKAYMDGSNRSVLVSIDISSPNGLSIDHTSSKVYWTDGGLRTINSINIDGTGRKTLLSGPSLPYPYGIDVFDSNIYWSDWMNKSIEKVNKVSGENRTIVATNLPDVMAIKVFHRNRKHLKTSCDSNNHSPCSDLCLLKPKGRTCACPTGIKLKEDKRTCHKGPLNYLIMAHRMDIRQISLDVPYMVDVVLPFKHLKTATSVDVDRKTGEVYWTDTAEDCIQKAAPDGSNRQTIISLEIESPDGIAIDSTGRKIYWTDAERNSIEVSELDGTNRKVLFNYQIYNPRAITLHYHHGIMFWSDWGTESPKIERASMDGTNRITIISENITWPNGLAIDRPANRLYWNDAKRNTIESCDLDGRNRRLILTKLPHPYGLVVVGNHIYWTDWRTESLHRAEKETGDDRTIIRGDLPGLMDIRSIQYDNIAENACGRDNGGCSHLCLRNPKGFSCVCPTGLSPSKDNPKRCQTVPDNFLLTAARYSLSQLSLDTMDAWDVTLPIKDDMQNVIAIDFHWKKKLIFYADIGRNIIMSVSMHNFSDVRVIASKDLQSPEGLSVDWLADNIYWTNTGRKMIEVAKLDGRYRKVIAADLVDPRSIAVNGKTGYLYWSDWNPSQPRIERAHLDGSSRKAIVYSDIAFPIGLVVDFDNRRLYWIDAKLNEERIETSDYHGRNRVTIPIDKTHPFSLALYQQWIFWTDWDQRCIMRAEKINGHDKLLVRPMHAAMGITMVTEERQTGWNPCLMNNGNCTHFCFYKKQGVYSCGCPDEEAIGCKKYPMVRVDPKCPENKGYDCPGPDDEFFKDDDYFDSGLDHDQEPDPAENAAMDRTVAFYVITLVPMVALVLGSVAIVAYIFIKKGKKNYLYGASRSFSNPNYYSNDPSNPQNAGDRRQFIWKRLKYDKTQERVYEETVVANPEVTSLIPTILTPCSSNCEAVTPELERSPSVTPLHKVEIQ